MNYKVVEFTLEYRKPEKSYFVETKWNRESMVKLAFEIPFLAYQRRISFVAFCPKQSATCVLEAKHIAAWMEYDRPYVVQLPVETRCKYLRKKFLQFYKEVDNFFASSRKRAVETGLMFISKRPPMGVDFKVKAPVIIVFREARPLLACTLFPEAVSSSSSCDVNSDITIEINMNNMHGFERDILKLGKLYNIRETSESGSWILNINRLVGLSTKKCSAFKKNITFKPETFKSLSEEKLFIAVQSLVKKHFSTH